MSHDVFISYSSKDKAIANAACSFLEAGGIRCWIAPRDIHPGKIWAEEVIKAIHDCVVFVMIFSSNSNESDNVFREINHAANHGKCILPLRIEEILPSNSMGYFVNEAHWLDALTPPLEKHLIHLVDAVQFLLNSA